MLWVSGHASGNRDATSNLQMDPTRDRRCDPVVAARDSFGALGQELGHLNILYKSSLETVVAS
jgi:hypothetical protein